MVNISLLYIKQLLSVLHVDEAEGQLLLPVQLCVRRVPLRYWQRGLQHRDSLLSCSEVTAAVSMDQSVRLSVQIPAQLRVRRVS